MVLVPAAMTLLGERAWWLPRRWQRWLPAVDVDRSSASGLDIHSDIDSGVGDPVPLDQPAAR
jgi:RND superfamily putative drug exporter